MVILCVHFHQLRLKVFAYVGEMQAQFLNGIGIKHTSPVFGNEDQMHMHHKYAVSTGSNGLFVCHRPIIICTMESTKTLQLRIKDKHTKVLRQMAREVNQVWNHINAISAKAARPFHGKPKYLSGYDLQKFTAGYSKCDDVSVGSGTVQLVCVEYATRRRQFKKTRLNWRVSNPKSAKYSLGWIPFKGGHAQYKAGQIQFAGNKLSLWDSYGLSDYELRGGSFSEDSRAAGISMWRLMSSARHHLAQQPWASTWASRKRL